MTSSDLTVLFYLLTFFVALLVVGVLFFVVRYTAKQREFKLSKAMLEQQFQTQMAQVQFEVAENTIHRISRELHDNICQSLLVSCRELDKEISHSTQGKHLQHVRDSIMDSLNTLRALSHSLSNHRLDNGLLEAMKVELERMKEVFEIQGSITIIEDPEVSIDYTRFSEAEIDLVFYRCFQELISNIIKHSACTHVEVSLYGTDQGWHKLVVKDNGIGMNVQEMTTGLGLRNLRDRMQLLKGHMHISSEQGEGTEIQLSL